MGRNGWTLEKCLCYKELCTRRPEDKGFHGKLKPVIILVTGSQDLRKGRGEGTGS